MSMGTSAWASIVRPPARNTPKRIPAKKVPTGLFRPSNATVMASNPVLPVTPSVRYFRSPVMVTPPARPHSAPERVNVTVVTLPIDIPAVFAASGLAPTARSSNPHVERSRYHHTKTVARRAMTTPPLIWNGGAVSGSCAVASIVGERGSPDPGRRKD